MRALNHRYGWGGEVQGDNATHTPPELWYGYSGNRRTDPGFAYDAAGNLTNDGNQSYLYDATGQQTYAGPAGGGWGAAPTYHDEPIQANVTTVQALHITELRTAINLLRNHLGYGNYSWTTSATTSDYINAGPIIEMRTALNEALGPPPTPGYAPALAQGQPIKAIHIQELRDRVTTAWNAHNSSALNQAYDGDGLLVKKTENGATTYYLRSTVLSGQVIAELNSSGNWSRGYVYSGSSLMAVQQGGVFWVYEDPITKSKRVCDANGTTVSGIETDPFGADTSRSFSQAFQPRKYTTYDRDANGSDEAMFRRYNRWHSRFDQPDPLDGSYNLADPQSLNRFAYVSNDPVNFRDPFGLDGKPGDLCPGGVIGNDGKCHAGPSVTITVTGSLFGDYTTPAWKNPPIIIDLRSIRVAVRVESVVSLPPRSVQSTTQRTQPKQQSRRDCIRAAVKTYFANQAAAGVRTYASWTNLGFLAVFTALTLGEAGEVAEGAEALEHTYHTGEALARTAGFGGYIAATLGVVQGVEEHFKNKEEFDKAVANCPPK